MSTADAIGLVILILLWLFLIVWAGIAVGIHITRRNRRR